MPFYNFLTILCQGAVMFSEMSPKNKNPCKIKNFLQKLFQPIVTRSSEYKLTMYLIP